MTNSDLIVASSFPFLPDNLLGSSSFGKSTSCLSCWKNSTTLEEGSADFGLIPVTRRCIVTAAALLAARPLCRHHGNITGIGLWSTDSDMTNPGTLSVYRLRANSTTILCHYGIISWPATPPSSSSADLKQFLYYPHSRTQFNFKSTGYRAWWCSCDPLRFPTWTEFLSFLPYNFCAPTPHPEIFRDFGCRMERLRIVISNP